MVGDSEHLRGDVKLRDAFTLGFTNSKREESTQSVCSSNIITDVLTLQDHHIV